MINLTPCSTQKYINDHVAWKNNKRIMNKCCDILDKRNKEQ